MKRRREDQRTIFGPNSLASCSRNRDNEGNSRGRKPHPIPLDLTIEILMRLPVKSLVRFQCVSNLWSSIIRRRDFVNSFLSHSSTRPRLLIGFSIDSWHFVLSSAHPQNPSEESSSVANHHLRIRARMRHCRLSDSFHGFFCVELWDKLLVCNPTTRQRLTLPRNRPMCPKRHHACLIRAKAMYIFGHDPSDDQHKVFCAFPTHECEQFPWEYQVFTLGAGNSWRKIEGVAAHYPVTARGVCVNGVLYYGALARHSGDIMMASFDVRSESLNLITMPVAAREVLMHPDSTLINYQGKLAFVHYCFARTEGRIDLWVLGDVGNEEWSKKSCVLPPSWADFVGDTRLRIQGTIHTGEIILAPQVLYKQFYVIYYDTSRNNIRRVEIEGIADGKFKRRYRLDDDFLFRLRFLDHVESIRFL